jgi:hypothetical protein
MTLSVQTLTIEIQKNSSSKIVERSKRSAVFSKIIYPKNYTERKLNLGKFGIKRNPISRRNLIYSIF